MIGQCLTGTRDRRRTFWATQPDACGSSSDNCGECGRVGLKLECGQGGASYSTENYVIGLALNILLTDARKPDSACGYAPGNRGGFWADSFRSDVHTSGSKLRQIPTTASVRETVSLVKAFAEDDLKKLVSYGVAVSVEVEATYKGNNQIDLGAKIIGQSGEIYRVGVAGQRIKNAWVWSN